MMNELDLRDQHDQLTEQHALEVTPENATTSQELPPAHHSLVLVYKNNPSGNVEDMGFMRLFEDKKLKDYFDQVDSQEVTDIRTECGQTLTEVDGTLIQKKLYDCFSELFALFFDIKMKREHSDKLNNVIKDKLAALAAKNAIVIDEKMLASNEQSINHYMKLLDELLVEVQGETDRFAMFARSNHIYINEHAPKNHFAMLEERMKSTKRYVKNVQRDINISFSRYTFGFESQMKQISYFEMMAARGK